MKNIIVIYSPICEATGAFLGTLHSWLDSKEVEIEAFSYDEAPKMYIDKMSRDENCFIEVFYRGERIDSVPLHRERIYRALGIEDESLEAANQSKTPDDRAYSEAELRELLSQGKLEFIPIDEESFIEEMTMCLTHYPMGNPAKEYHESCIAIKERVYREVFAKERVAGIYAKMSEQVVGLLEVFPREVLKKHGYMTGTTGDDRNYLTVGCYEVAYGIPRTFMLVELMYHLLAIKDKFFRKTIEGIGVLNWRDGFNPYWVYEKYGFRKVSNKTENTMVMELCIH